MQTYDETLTLSVPVVLWNSPNLCPYFSLNKFGRILLLIFSSLLCLINSHLLISKCLILCMLCKEKLGVDNWLGLKGLIPQMFTLEYHRNPKTMGYVLLTSNAWSIPTCALYMALTSSKSKRSSSVSSSFSPYICSTALYLCSVSCTGESVIHVSISQCQLLWMSKLPHLNNKKFESSNCVLTDFVFVKLKFLTSKSPSRFKSLCQFCRPIRCVPIAWKMGNWNYFCIVYNDVRKWAQYFLFFAQRLG